MVDEQEGCEWMNASSGTGSPVKSQTKGHKMVVCVRMKEMLEFSSVVLTKPSLYLPYTTTTTGTVIIISLHSQHCEQYSCRLWLRRS